MLSNVEFEKLYKGFKPMIIKLVTKWSRIGVIEYDDLMQFALLELVNAANTYDETRGTKFSTYVYTLIEYRLRREIQRVREKNRIKTVSINTTIESDEGSVIEILDMIEDTVDTASEVQDKIMVETYKAEITANLDKKKADVMILKYFHNLPNSYIEKTMNITGISNWIREGRMTLIRKSMLFRNEYNRIHHIDDYSNPSAVAII